MAVPATVSVSSAGFATTTSSYNIAYPAASVVPDNIFYVFNREVRMAKIIDTLQERLIHHSTETDLFV